MFFKTFVCLVICSFSVAQPDPADWWKHAVIYQIYPRSFKDNNNDGIGDLEGIISKLDHFPETGVNGIWMSPIFESPQVDQGYDISNYTKVDPAYGTNEILKKLIDEAHSRDIGVLLDFVPNHTSDKHQWFIDSVNGVEEYRDFYVWLDGKVDENGDRQPPNNWISVWKNSAWEWSEKRQQYYLHQFASAQPDLNYRNPKVVEAMKNVLRYWIDQGIDGFRCDAVNHLMENKDFLDEPLSNLPGYNSSDYEYLNHIYTKDQDETYEMVYQWRDVMDEYSGKILMIEAYSDTEHTMRFFGSADGSRLGAHCPFNFNFITDIHMDSSAQDIVNAAERWLQAIPENYTSNWVLGNHDNHRVATRFGVENVDGFNMLNLLLPGVAVTYNGEEIGQENGYVSYEEGQDPSARDPETFEQVSRDFERTPYQWDDTVNAGFNDGAKPWLPVSNKSVETNLQLEKEVPYNSHYRVYQAVATHRTDPILMSGTVDLKAIDQNVLLLKRTLDNVSIVLVFNKGDTDVTLNVAADVDAKSIVEVKSVGSDKDIGFPVNVEQLELKAHEALVLKP